MNFYLYLLDEEWIVLVTRELSLVGYDNAIIYAKSRGQTSADGEWILLI